MGGTITNKINRKKADKIIMYIISHLCLFGKVVVCGSYRRGKELIGDLDLVGDNNLMITKLCSLGEALTCGTISCRVIVRGVQIDLKIANKDMWGTSLMMWTGSKSENIRLRRIAMKKGLKLNEYGLWNGNINLAKGKTEEEIYKLLGEKYLIPSERK